MTTRRALGGHVWLGDHVWMAAADAFDRSPVDSAVMTRPTGIPGRCLCIQRA